MTETKADAKSASDATFASAPGRKWSCFAPLLTRVGPFARVSDGFDVKDNNFGEVQTTRVLIAGAGALGCEMLKQLAMSGFVDLHIIDLDVVKETDLHRNCLFRKKDIGQPKAKAAAEFVQKRCKGVTVKWYEAALRAFKAVWYSQFHFVLGALDSIEARTWLNATLADLVRFDPKDGTVDRSSVVFYVDGGTEGFRGQARLIVPHYTACFHCMIDSLPRAAALPLSTIVLASRTPEQCVQWAMQYLWERLTEFKSADDYVVLDRGFEMPQGPRLAFDKSNSEHLRWVLLRAQERADKFSVRGVDYNLVLAIAQNIIPAVASTPSLIAAECVNEVFKLRTFTAPVLDNFFMYIGTTNSDQGTHGESFSYRQNSSCSVCSKPHTAVKIPRDCTFAQLFAKLKDQDDNKPGAQGRFQLRQEQTGFFSLEQLQDFQLASTRVLDHIDVDRPCVFECGSYAAPVQKRVLLVPDKE